MVYGMYYLICAPITVLCVIYDKLNEWYGKPLVLIFWVLSTMAFNEYRENMQILKDDVKVITSIAAEKAFQFFKKHFEKFDKVYRLFTGESMRDERLSEFLEFETLDELYDDDEP